MAKKKFKFRMFFMEPPISQTKRPKLHEFKGINFDDAYTYSKYWIKENCKEGSVILLLAQLDR